MAERRVYSWNGIKSGALATMAHCEILINFATVGKFRLFTALYKGDIRRRRRLPASKHNVAYRGKIQGLKVAGESVRKRTRARHWQIFVVGGIFLII